MDFGGSRTVAGLTKYPYYGTEGYMAPEVEAKGPLRQPSDLFKADVYSLAVTMVEMLTGRSTAHVPSGIDPALADLLRSMLSRHPGERPDTAAIKKHRWWAGAAAVAH
jgi:serine/threonine protein kinase